MGIYSRRLTRNRRPLASAELMCLVVVVAASLLTAWYAGHTLVMNLSVLETAASFLGITETTGMTRQVGYSQAREQAADGQTTGAPAAAAAQFCQAGETPAFANGMAALKQQMGDAMGTPVQCEHVASVGGDTIQQTSTGLAAYNRSTNTVTFTDGWRHWALTANGFVTWEGTEANPPPNAVAADGEAGAPPTQDQ